MVLPLTDMGNSERFVRDHSRDVRYSTRTKTWLVWSGSRWTEDPSESEIQNRAKMTVRSIPQEVTIDPALKEDILKHAIKSETLWPHQRHGEVGPVSPSKFKSIRTNSMQTHGFSTARTGS